jgi:hypothetical protein
MSEIDLCEAYLRVGSSVTVNRKLCVTSRRYLDWVSEGVVTGDIVCIFAGATVPFLLRPDGNWHFQSSVTVISKVSCAGRCWRWMGCGTRLQDQMTG